MKYNKTTSINANFVHIIHTFDMKASIYTIKYRRAIYMNHIDPILGRIAIFHTITFTPVLSKHKEYISIVWCNNDVQCGRRVVAALKWLRRFDFRPFLTFDYFRSEWTMPKSTGSLISEWAWLVDRTIFALFQDAKFVNSLYTHIITHIKVFNLF